MNLPETTNLLLTTLDTATISIGIPDIPDMVSIGSAIIMCIMTVKQHLFHKKIEKDKNTPFLYPEKSMIIKDKMHRYLAGGASSDNVIPSTNYEDLDDFEQKFLDDCKNHKDRAYFYHLKNSLLLVINGNDGSANIIAEHNNAEVTLKNYGALITKMHINYVEVVYTTNETKVYKGVENRHHTNVIPTNGLIIITLDEVVNNLNQAFCNITENIYSNLQDFDMFTTDTPDSLKYNKFTIELVLWNQYNQSFTYQIIIKKIDKRFQREVIPVK